MTARDRILLGLAIGLALVVGVSGAWPSGDAAQSKRRSPPANTYALPPVPDTASDKGHRFARAAEKQQDITVSYDPRYRVLTFPNGDVPIETGVCTDVVVRAFRSMGVDPQVEINRDMKKDFSAYPQIWKAKRPDPNIDHRRVPNVRRWLEHKGKDLPVTSQPADYQPGDIVSWKPIKRPHIGVVSTQRTPNGQRFMIAHNFGDGVVLEDVLFRWEITGHYRPY